MMTLLETECTEAITQSLQRLTDELTRELRAILAEDHPSGTHFLWFHFDPAHFAEDFPVFFFTTDRRGEPRKVRELLSGVSCTIPEDIIDNPRFNEDDLIPSAIASDLLVLWFADCWEKAGGKNSRWPGYIAHHDSIFSFDLTHRRELKSPEPRYHPLTSKA